jgi:DNA-binding NarL/FixJ family response regulator
MDERNSLVRVLVVEADSLSRDMLRAVIHAHPQTEVAGATGDAAEAPRLAVDGRAHVALIGLAADNERETLAAARAIAGAGASTRIVMLGDRPDRRTLAAMPAFRSAGWSYLLRQSVSDVETLVRALSDAASGLVVLDPLVVESVGRGQSRLAALTRRQLEVLSLMARGYNNAAIARALVLEEKSVENHINAIFGQLALNRDAAAHPRVKAVLLYLNESDEPQAHAA